MTTSRRESCCVFFFYLFIDRATTLSIYLQVFSDIDSKRKGGTIAMVTKGLLDRTTYYEHALCCALAPFCHDDTGLYRDDDAEPVPKRCRAESPGEVASGPS